MNRRALERYLRQHGCRREREGSRHTIWSNPATGQETQVPRHTEIKTPTMRQICADLSVPDPPGR
jgi:hypothetical protein